MNHASPALGIPLMGPDPSRRIYMQATKLRESAFTTVVLPGTGSGSWSSLWEAARKFSEELAYPEEPFPAVGDGARCVLCQQDLDHAARHRLETFEAFVATRSTTLYFLMF